MLIVDERSCPIGAELTSEGVHFRVWAPKCKKVCVSVQGGADSIQLEAEENGYFSGFKAGLMAGTKYTFLLDEDSKGYPDPASRFQPEGVHGPSEVIDSTSFQWSDSQWRGLPLPGQVIYEMHIGCFTPEGTWRAAEKKLPFLVETGITVLEVMPVAEFGGKFGWGYDGVYWYAPTRLYGSTDDFKHFVDTAHRLGLAVMLDVVYNHFGPTGNYTSAFSPYFVSQRHPTEWGDALNFDGQGAAGVREYVVQNAAYWIREFHLDGLRLDATQSIFDDTKPHIVAELTSAARDAAPNRDVIIVAENETQEVEHVDPVEQGGFGLDGLWNDDFHHTCRVAATGHAEYYYSDYAGSPQEMLSAMRYGYLFQGQYSQSSKRYRGTPAWHVPAWRFITFLQNHDQVSNSTNGSRLPFLTSPGRHRALTTMWLMAPGTPMFFMGQEYGESNPFPYFADHDTELAGLVRDGRFQTLRQFGRIAGWEGSKVELPEPASIETFQKSKLHWSEAAEHNAEWRLHKDLLHLRKTDPTISKQDKKMLQGTVINHECFALRWHCPNNDDRLLLVNLGRDLRWQPAAEPLVAPPHHMEWKVLFSSEDQQYGGSGTGTLDTKHWSLPGHAALLLGPTPRSES